MRNLNDGRKPVARPNGTYVLAREEPERPKRRSKALSKHTKNKRIRKKRRAARADRVDNPWRPNNFGWYAR